MSKREQQEFFAKLTLFAAAAIFGVVVGVTVGISTKSGLLGCGSAVLASIVYVTFGAGAVAASERLFAWGLHDEHEPWAPATRMRAGAFWPVVLLAALVISTFNRLVDAFYSSRRN